MVMKCKQKIREREPSDALKECEQILADKEIVQDCDEARRYILRYFVDEDRNFGPSARVIFSVMLEAIAGQSRYESPSVKKLLSYNNAPNRSLPITLRVVDELDDGERTGLEWETSSTLPLFNSYEEIDDTLNRMITQLDKHRSDYESALTASRI